MSHSYKLAYTAAAIMVSVSILSCMAKRTSSSVKDVGNFEANQIFYMEGDKVTRKTCTGAGPFTRNCDHTFVREVPARAFFSIIATKSDTASYHVLDRGLERIKAAHSLAVATSNDSTITEVERQEAAQRAAALAVKIPIVERIHTLKEQLESLVVVNLDPSRLELKLAEEATAGDDVCVATCGLVSEQGMPMSVIRGECYETSSSQSTKTIEFRIGNADAAARQNAAAAACTSLGRVPYSIDVYCKYQSNSYQCVYSAQSAPAPTPTPVPAPEETCGPCKEATPEECVYGRRYTYYTLFRGLPNKREICTLTIGACESYRSSRCSR